MRSLLVLLILTVPVSAEERFRVERKKTAPAETIPQRLREQLSPEALVVTHKDGSAYATLHLRQELPSSATPEQVANGLTYAEIKLGTWIGVIELAATWTDFRKQEVPAGTYALRLMVQPQVGDHHGTSPYPDFCLLTPLTKDTTPEPIEAAKVLAWSRDVLGADHPSPLLLFPNHKPPAQPTIVDQGKGIHVLQATIAVRTEEKVGRLGFGFVIHGHSETR